MLGISTHKSVKRDQGDGDYKTHKRTPSGHCSSVSQGQDPGPTTLPLGTPVVTPGTEGEGEGSGGVGVTGNAMQQRAWVHPVNREQVTESASGRISQPAAHV